MSLCHEIISHSAKAGGYGIQAGSDIISACIQADATLRGSSRQATATIFGDLAVLIAGFTTLCAAIIAYKAATSGIKEDRLRRRELSDLYPAILHRKLARRAKAIRLIIIIIDKGEVSRFKSAFPYVDRVISERLSPPWNETGYDLIRKLGPDLTQGLLTIDNTTELLLDLGRSLIIIEELKPDRLKKSSKIFNTLNSHHSNEMEALAAAFPELETGEAPPSEGEAAPLDSDEGEIKDSP